MGVTVNMAWISGGFYDTRNNTNGGGDSLIKNPVGAFITGGVTDAPAGIRISTVDGPIEVPKARSYENYPNVDEWIVDPKLKGGWKEREEKEKKKKARARKWEKRLKVIKALLHKIKEKLKE